MTAHPYHLFAYHSSNQCDLVDMRSHLIPGPHYKERQIPYRFRTESVLGNRELINPPNQTANESGTRRTTYVMLRQWLVQVAKPQS